MRHDEQVMPAGHVGAIAMACMGVGSVLGALVGAPAILMGVGMVIGALIGYFLVSRLSATRPPEPAP